MVFSLVFWYSVMYGIMVQEIHIFQIFHHLESILAYSNTQFSTKVHKENQRKINLITPYTCTAGPAIGRALTGMVQGISCADM